MHLNIISNIISHLCMDLKKKNKVLGGKIDDLIFFNNNPIGYRLGIHHTLLALC